MFFVVILSHPEGPKWQEHVQAHVDYLLRMVSQGSIRASGRLTGKALRSGMYIATVADRGAVDKLVADDPFTPAGLMASVDVFEWDPFIGSFADETGGLPKELAAPAIG